MQLFKQQLVNRVVDLINDNNISSRFESFACNERQHCISLGVGTDSIASAQPV